jgi:hypothetical protein
MSDVGHSRRLRVTVELLLPRLTAAARALMNHPRIADLYPEYLSTMHCIVRASVPLMEAALERARAMAESDAVAAGAAAYLEQHLPEEIHHDEWLLEDLAVLGRDPSELLRRLPSPTVAALVGSQYYWILHYHPAVLLGYIAVMEGYPPTVDRVEDLVTRTGHPRDAFRTLFKHARLDVHHREDLDGTLDSLPLSRQPQALLGVSALRTVYLASCVLQELLESPAGWDGSPAGLTPHIAQGR